MRIYTDGCFDLFHFGHANACRQSKQLGGYLIVGVNSTESANKYKSPLIMTDEERFEVVKSCRWVDETIPSTPYFLDKEFTESLKCDVIIHGDDNILDIEGNNCYEYAMLQNKFKQFERTRGISTSNIVGRMLNREFRKKEVSKSMKNYYEKLLNEFEIKRKEKKGRVIYIDGTFDLYHAGHTSIIEEAKKRGDYLIVGVHSDEEIRKHKGEEPIMREVERRLCIMSNINVDEILANAPFKTRKEFIKEHRISEIVCGKENTNLYKHLSGFVDIFGFSNKFYYLNYGNICQRIISNHQEYLKKVKKENNMDIKETL